MYLRAPSSASRTFSVQRSAFSVRRGLTLVEMLVSLACVIILMMAYTQLFSNVGSGINDARSMIELSNRMRSAENMLRNDLAGHTCDMTVWQKPESGAGYFEILEGPLSERYPGIQSGAPVPNTYPLGDTDDVLMFTARSQGAQFVGRKNVGGVEPVHSEVAEVVWFLRPTMRPPAAGSTSTTPVEPPTFTLYRRTFLVTPGVALAQVSQTDFENCLCDRSMHFDTTINQYVANTLGDLTKRENRAGHVGAFPHRVDPNLLVPFGGRVNTLTHEYYVDANAAYQPYLRYGEDAVLTNVIAFDVQVWDSSAPVYTNGRIAIGPSDPGFKSLHGNDPPNATYPTNQGAYVDLNWFVRKTPAPERQDKSWTNPTDPTQLQWFSNASPPPDPLFLSPFFTGGLQKPSSVSLNLAANFPATPSLNYQTPWLNGAVASGRPAVYDTWSFPYENNGGTPNGPGDEDKDGTVDEGTNGLDDDGANGVDDPGEYETMPPYPYPMRGVKITLRCYDPDSRQIREVSIVESFVPE